MRMLWLPLTVAALMSPLSAPAQQNPFPSALSATAAGRTLTLAEAVGLAMRQHPELSAARQEIEAVGGARAQASARPNPQLAVEWEDTRPESRTTTLMLSQTIELGAKRDARQVAAQREYEIAEVQWLARKAAIRSAVAEACMNALIAQERVHLADLAAQLAQSGSEAAARRVVAGKIAPIEETRARLAESSIRIESMQARSELQAALHDVTAAVGSTGPAIERIEGDAHSLPAIPTLLELEQLLAASPTARLAQLELDRQGARVGLERSRRVPDLAVSVGAKREAERGRHQAVLGLSIPLPVFDTNQGSLTEALRRQDKARHEAQAGTVRLRADALRARERLAAADKEVQALQRDILPGAAELHAAALKGLALGKLGVLETLDAQRSLLLGRSQYLKALAQAHRARFDLDRLVGIDTLITGPLPR